MQEHVLPGVMTHWPNVAAQATAAPGSQRPGATSDGTGSSCEHTCGPHVENWKENTVRASRGKKERT